MRQLCAQATAESSAAVSSGQAEEEMRVSPEPLGPSGQDEEEEEMHVSREAG